jgi:hypothetical protein
MELLRAAPAETAFVTGRKTCHALIAFKEANLQITDPTPMAQLRAVGWVEQSETQQPQPQGASPNPTRRLG